MLMLLRFLNRRDLMHRKDGLSRTVYSEQQGLLHFVFPAKFKVAGRGNEEAA